jgi:N-acetylglucosamine kinase-like BadF-type ATPase
VEQKALVAVDAGGSKTEYAVRLLPGKVVRRYVYGGSNYRAVGLEKAYDNLIKSFFTTCEVEGLSPKDIQGAVFGVSGCDSEEDMLVYRKMVSEIGLDSEHIMLYNDCELAFLAAAKAPGLCVVSGTGSNCMAFYPNKPVLRAGGWGALLSDGGSGFWIARQVLESMLLFCDGIGKNRPIYEGIAKHFGISDFLSVQAKFVELGVPEIASSARVILEYAEAGDKYAREVVHTAHLALWELVAALMHRMAYAPEEPLDVVLNGSLFKNKWFLEEFWNGMVKRIPNPLNKHLVTENTSENAMRLAEKLYGGV